MKKYLLSTCLITLVTCFAGLNADTKQSKTFMWTRPLFLNITAEQAVWHDFIYNKPTKGGVSVQIKSIYQKSLTKESIKQYFLFGCMNELLVAGDTANSTANRNVRAEWLGIKNSNFSGKLTINPEQRQTAFSITLHKDISTLFNFSFFQDYWISIELPVVALRNSLNLEQYDVYAQETTNPSDIISAFNQKAWRYAKIPKERSRIGAVGLFAKFGRAYLSENHYQVVYYSTFNIPFGDGQNPEYLFDAYSGTNRHFGAGAGANFQILLNQDASNYAACWYISLEHLFLFRNKQWRTFDLKGKPWSRYLLFNRKDGPPDQNIPGVNILTLKSRVRPYSFVEFATGWRLIAEKFELEIGYSLWGHGDERVKILCDFEEIYGIAGKGSFNNAGIYATSASMSTIAQQATNDTITTDMVTSDIFVPIKKSDLDRSSAEAQSSINHKFNASFGYLKKGNTFDGFFCIGGALEFPQRNTALHTWSVWLKIGTAH